MGKRQLVTILALAVMSAPALADNLLILARPGNASFTSCATANIPLNPAGGIVFPFVNPVAGPVTITFTAECAVAGPLPDQSRWVSAVIFLDGTTACVPTSGLNALCSGNGTAALDGWVGASVTCVRTLAAGAHTLRIQKVAGGGATSCWISDTSTVVTR